MSEFSGKTRLGKIRLEVEASREYYDQVLDQYSDHFSTIEKNLTSIPNPEDLQPSYSYQEKRGLSVKEAAEEECDALDEIVGNFKLRFPKLEGLELILKRTILTNRTIFTRFTEQGPKDKKRKYENKLSILHPIETTYLASSSSRGREIIRDLSHDSVEDSHRYNILKKWYFGESLSPEEKAVMELGEETKITDEKIRKKIFNQKTQEIVEEYLELINISPESDMYSFLFHGINLVTKRPWEGYDDYTDRIAGKTDNLDVWLESVMESRFIRLLYMREPLFKDIVDRKTDYQYSAYLSANANPSLVLSSLDLKARDRNNNSHFSVPDKESGESNEMYIARIGKKRILDGHKNFLILENFREFQLQNKPIVESEISRSFYGLAEINGRNMDEFLTRMQETYTGTDVEYRGRPLDEWFSRIETQIHNYFQSGGFDRITEARKTYESLLHFDGSVRLLSDFVNNEILDEVQDTNAGNLFGEKEADKRSHVLRLYKYGAIIKTLSSLFMSHAPFDEEGRLIEGMGVYAPEYETYNLAGIEA